MNKRTVKTLFAVLLAICMIGLSACLPVGVLTGKQNGNTTAPDQDQNTVPEANGYRVTVTDFAGRPITGVIVMLMQNGTRAEMAAADENGVAVFDAESGEYSVELNFTSEEDRARYVYDLTGVTLHENQKEQTVILYENIMDSVSFFKDDVEYQAGKVTEGGYRVDLKAGVRNYFLFRPTRAGLYEISYISEQSLTIGTYGMPIYVHDTSTHDAVNGVITMEIKKSYIGETEEGTTPTLIGLDLPQGAADSTCILTVRHVRDFTLEEDDAYIYVPATEAQMKSFTPPTGELTDLNLTDRNLTLVKNENDGLYHLGTADGPVIYMRVTSATSSAYLGGGSLEGVGATLFGAMIYDANGNYLRRESYNAVINSYVEYCNEYNKDGGVCPLTDDLINMMQVAGGARGWYDKTNANEYLFSEVIGLVEENAWMFLCCYYR